MLRGRTKLGHREGQKRDRSRKGEEGAIQLVLWLLSLTFSASLSFIFSPSSYLLPLFFPSIPSSHTPPGPSPLVIPDEVYAQKMKYKAISEELDNALNDITSL